MGRMPFVSVALVLTACVVHTAGQSDVWKVLTPIIEEAIKADTTPGAVAVVGNASHIFYAEAVGQFTYGLPPPFSGGTIPPMQLTTLFDMASCSKIVAATTSVALLYQQGLLDLHAPVTHYLGDGFASQGKGGITVLNCLLHNAGYPPDPSPLYYDTEFGCPIQPHGREGFDCQARIYDSLLNQTLQYPTGQQYLYSDLSFITLMHVVGSVVKTAGLVPDAALLPDCVLDPTSNATFQCYYEAYTRLTTFPTMNMQHTYYRPAQSLWGSAAPCENYTDSIFVGTFQGQVSDRNTYAMGGVSGHAGVFSTALDMVEYARRWLFSPSPLLPTTQRLFRTNYDPTFSSRALGFNTCNSNTSVSDACWNFSCGTLSSSTFMHTGYTGTEVCMDPDRQLFTVLLTNRVYPDETHSAKAIHALRNAFNTQVQKIFDAL